MKVMVFVRDFATDFPAWSPVMAGITDLEGLVYRPTDRPGTTVLLFNATTPIWRRYGLAVEMLTDCELGLLCPVFVAPDMSPDDFDITDSYRDGLS